MKIASEDGEVSEIFYEEGIFKLFLVHRCPNDTHMVCIYVEDTLFDGYAHLHGWLITCFSLPWTGDAVYQIFA